MKTITLEVVDPSKPTLLWVLPEYGAPAPGVCTDYDGDCFEMTQAQRTSCWLYGEPTDGKPAGICPFMD